jgi:hypothetical protein
LSDEAAIRADERERIAKWHERQADALEQALEKIIREGGTVEVNRRSLAELHRSFAAAIRAGAE